MKVNVVPRSLPQPVEACPVHRLFVSSLNEYLETRERKRAHTKVGECILELVYKLDEIAIHGGRRPLYK